MIQLFNTFLVQPMLNILILLYETAALKDLGVAIIFLTILIRLILFPIFQKSAKHARAMQVLQPKMKKIQEEHKKDRAKQAEAMMALYREHKISPFSPFLLMLVQLPVLIALYQVFQTALSPESLTDLYGFVPHPQSLDFSFLGLINLTEKNIFIVGLAALAQYFQGKLSLPKSQPDQKLSAAEKMTRNMVFIGPLLTVFVLFRFPSALGLYWLTSSIFSLGQQWFANKQSHHGPTSELRKEPRRTDGV